jgi:hypothetical protein
MHLTTTGAQAFRHGARPKIRRLQVCPFRFVADRSQRMAAPVIDQFQPTEVTVIDATIDEHVGSLMTDLDATRWTTPRHE